MPRRTLILATIAVVIVVAIGAGARAQELSCPPGYAPDQNNTSCVPSQPSAGPAQGGVAGQAQQLLNSFGAAVQGAQSNAAGALGPMLNSFGLGGSGAAPQGYNGSAAQGAAPQGYNGGTAQGAAPQGYNGGTAQGGVGGAATNDYGGQHPLSKISAHAPCALLTANDVATVLGDSVTWSSAGSGGPNAASACSYATTNNADVDINLGGRAEFEKLPSQLSGMTPLSGVGDAAYNGPKSTGGSGGGAQVFVLKGATYFYITVQSDNGDTNDARTAAALARKVAARIKTK